MSAFKNLLSLIFIFSSFIAQAQNKFTISGTISDAKNGEALIGATVYIKELKLGVITNAYGFYSLTADKGNYTLQVSYVGYATVEQKLNLTQNQKLNFELAEETETLGEVVVSGEKADKNIKENKMSSASIEIKQIKKIPILLGEVDVIKAVQLLPGIQAAGDGNTLLVVRGGNIDQNLVLLDEAVVYNPSHVVGFFSVFNGDAIKDFELLKGGVPANYGGRLSSVMDVRMKEGNSKKLGVSGGIGVLSSRVTVEGPLSKSKDVGSFMISGRRSYFDLFFPLSEQTRDVSAYFFDINAKINYKIGEKDRIYLSAYNGRDKLGVAGLIGLGWGNTTTTLRWNHIFTDKLFMNVSAIYSRYNYNFDLDIARNLNFRRLNYIDDYVLKADFNYYISPKSSLKFGASGTYHIFEPGKRVPITSESLITEAALPRKKALDNYAYISHKIDVNARLNVEYGLRISQFSNIGGRSIIYENNTPNSIVNGAIRPNAQLGFNNYRANEIFNTYYGIEPRLGTAYQINSSSSLKGSYNRMYQYMNLIQNTTASIGQEFWIPVDNYIKPQYADQVALGYFRNFFENQIEASVEVYYKSMYNTPELIDNADIGFNEAIESQLVLGRGRAYGSEFLIKKPKGKTTGWLAYTLAKSERRADNINNGDWYSFRFDRTHYLTLVVTHDFNERFTLAGNFIYATGEAVTAPVGTYTLNGNTLPLYSARNGVRIPAYHRADLSLTINRKKVEGKTYKNESNWVISIYNIYGQKNVYSLSFQQNPDTGQNEIIKTYLFRLVPSVTYNFKF